tara:strand:+ start:193 stop:792 length:600 start_codon:yes stop_codon:yes gene_type:complete
MRKTNYFLNFIKSYRNIFLKVFLFELFFSIKFKDFFNNIVIHNNEHRTDTVPCVYYFLFKISKFIKKEKIKSIIDIGSGLGRILNYIYHQNKIKCYGIEFDKNTYRKSLKLSNKKIKIYNGDALKFDFDKKKFECFILVDPFKKNYHKKKFLNKLLKLKQKKIFVILINFKQILVPKQFKIVYSLIAGKERSLKIYKII